MAETPRDRRRQQRAPGGVVGELGPLADPVIGRPPPFRPPPPFLTAVEPPQELEEEDEDDRPRLFVVGAERAPGAASAPVRVYHVVGVRTDGGERLCWAFTITRAAVDNLATEGTLLSEGATYPNGRPVVETGVDPGTVDVRCGTCWSTHLPRVALRFVAR